MLYTTVTTNNGPYIEQCIDLDSARHDMDVDDSLLDFY